MKTYTITFAHSSMVRTMLAILILISINPIFSYSQHDCTSEKLIHMDRGFDTTAASWQPPSNSTSVSWSSGYNLNKERIAYFVHGLGGNASSLSKMAESVGLQYNIIPILNQYSGNSLASAAQSLNNNMFALSNNINNLLGQPTPKRNMIIAHSQGGLVGRALDYHYAISNTPASQQLFGGIVTFGTPHLGAQILNNIPEMVNYINFSSQALLKGPILEQLYSNWIIGLFVDESQLNNGLVAFGNYLSKQLIPIAFSDYLAPITSDYRVGASYIQELNNHQAETPMVSFYGIENEPILWRTLHSFHNNPNEFDAFTADYDLGVMADAWSNKAYYYSKFNAYSDLYDALSNSGCSWWQYIFFPQACISNWMYDDLLNLDNVFGIGEQKAKEIRNAYYEGAQWWANANDSYKYLIGSYSYQDIVSNSQYICKCSFNSGFLHYDLYNTYTIGYPCEHELIYLTCEELPLIVTTFVTKTSDGVVLAESASTLPAGYNSVAAALSGSNHQQMRNDSKAGYRLSNLFYGQFGNFFQTEEQ